MIEYFVSFVFGVNGMAGTGNDRLSRPAPIRTWADVQEANRALAKAYGTEVAITNWIELWPEEVEDPGPAEVIAPTDAGHLRFKPDPKHPQKLFVGNTEKATSGYYPGPVTVDLEIAEQMHQELGRMLRAMRRANQKEPSHAKPENESDS